MKTEISAGGVIHKRIDNDFCIALILSQDKKWTFPKGHIEEDEKPEEAAIREVSEEIGIPNLKAEVLLEKIDYFFSADNEKIHKFVYYFLMQAPDDAELIPQMEEVGDAQWIKSSDVLDKISYKEDISVIKKAFLLLKI